MEATHDHAHGHDAHGHHPTGIMRWVQTTNHKDIGRSEEHTSELQSH